MSNPQQLELRVKNLIVEYHYTKELRQKKAVANWRHISEWLEQAGDRITLTASSAPVAGVTLPVETLETSVKLIYPYNYNPTLPNSPTFQIHFHGVATVSTDMLKPLIAAAAAKEK